MRRLLPLLSIFLSAPLLLAPIRYQTGHESIILAPTQGTASSSYALPAATVLKSPTVITLSPTVLPAVSGTAKGLTKVSSTVVQKTITVIVAPEPLMASATAIICNKGLQTVAEMAINSYQQQRQQAAMNLVIASTVAAAEAAQRHYPLLTATQESLGKLQSNTPQLKELRTAGALALAACKNPLAPAYKKPAPGSRIPVPRPD